MSWRCAEGGPPTGGTGAGPVALPRADPGRRPVAGFTLIEILVALAILAMVLGAGLEVVSRGASALAISDDHRRAVALAGNVLKEFGAGALETGVLEGVDETGPLQMHWEATVTPYAGDELGPVDHPTFELMAVSVRVSWNDGARGRAVSLDGLHLAAPGRKLP